MSSDAMSEESSVHEGAGYDEAFGSGVESEDFSPSLERETSAQSPDDEDESYAEGSEEVGVDKVGKEGSGSDGDDDGDEESCKGISVVPGDNHPSILPEDSPINKFLPMMSDKVCKELHSCYHILDHIPIRLLRENERCYSGRIANVGMYDTMFAAGLRLPLTAFHR